MKLIRMKDRLFDECIIETWDQLGICESIGEQIFRITHWIMQQKLFWYTRT